MSFQEPHHLPKLRAEGDPADPDELPRQRRGITPQMHGRYPDWDVLGQSKHWDEKTRQVVLKRVHDPPSIHFFTAIEAETLKAYCDAITNQYREPRIPVLSFVDEKLRSGLLDGYQYADMPEDRDTWRIVAAGLEHSARSEWCARSFSTAPRTVREDIVQAFSEGKLGGGPWQQVNVQRAFRLTTKHICQAFYSHPWAWNEIGFGGPAYPRGYAAFGSDALGPDREQWEPVEAYSREPGLEVKERGLE